MFELNKRMWRCPAKSPSLSDIYSKVAAKADTDGLIINVADTKRVLACLFDALLDEKSQDAFDFVSKGLKRAASRRG